jgi:hypothetical protein
MNGTKTYNTSIDEAFVTLSSVDSRAYMGLTQNDLQQPLIDKLFVQNELVFPTYSLPFLSQLLNPPSSTVAELIVAT